MISRGISDTRYENRDRCAERPEKGMAETVAPPT